MQKINNYISEKLHINKDFKANTEAPWYDKHFDFPFQLLSWIVEKVPYDTIVHDDTERWSAKENGFDNFDTTYGTSIDWLDSFWNETSGNMVAIWKKTDELMKNPIIKYFIDSFSEETLYSKRSYYVKKWGTYEMKDPNWKKTNCEISMLEAVISEDHETIICINICTW